MYEVKFLIEVEPDGCWECHDVTTPDGFFEVMDKGTFGDLLECIAFDFQTEGGTVTRREH